MSAQHTPGPWVATGNGIHHGTRCVALTHMEPWEQRVTDARLIAAAPEMLDVLVSFTRSPYVKANHPKKYAAALAAIAKATGEQA